ncbi:hypothetical protein V492_07225 [Pseudogymnoascus sp. VKM F-4246]|nr:hypothetical protein V492_07225 [Pseudogymnoascus sp. VKM F-4246]
MSLANLPSELIISVGEYLHGARSLSCFARTNRHVYSLVVPLLYQYGIKDGLCSGLQAQLIPHEPNNSTSRFFIEMEEDQKEYDNPSNLTTPEGLPIPVTDHIRIRDAVIGKFVKYGADLNELNAGGYQILLHFHAETRNSTAVFLMAKHGVNLHTSSGYENATTLHWAALGGCARIIRFLIKKGVDVNSRDSDDRIPLHYAAQRGHTAAIRLLTENGADINAQDDSGYTPLHLMAMNGMPASDSWCISGLKAMLELGPNTELGMFDDNKTPLHIAILNQRDEAFMKVLLESGMNLNARTVEGRTPLSCCIERGEMCLFMTLLNAGADIHTRDEDGRSLLQVALEDDDRAYGCLPTLLENGLFALDSDAGDGKTLVQFLKDRDWLYTIKGRVDGMPEIDDL